VHTVEVLGRLIESAATDHPIHGEEPQPAPHG